MNTKFFGITNKNKFLNELEKVLKEKFPDKKDVDEIINSIGQANGIASLDGSGKVPSEQLPSYVDDIIEVEDYAHLPEVGETGKIYITLDTGNQYRWGGSEYVPLNENSVQGIGIKKIIKLTQAEYDALVTKDPLAVYLVDASLQNGVYVAYTDGSLSNYDVLDTSKTPVGPLLKTNNVCLIVHPDDATGKSWATNIGMISNVFTTTNKDVAATDFSGESNTLAVIASQKQGTAFDFATQAVYADGRIGHLPSYGEMVDICDNVTNINTVLTLMGGTPIVYNTSRNYWTSTQNNSENSWYYMMNWPGSDRKTNAYEGRYCRSVSNYDDSRIILYLGSILIADSFLPSEIASILATI